MKGQQGDGIESHSSGGGLPEAAADGQVPAADEHGSAVDGRAASDGGRAPPGSARPGTGFWSVVQSVGAAMIGVQSRRNRERDFTEGKPWHFVVGGIIGTLLFLFAVWLLVRYLIATS